MSKQRQAPEVILHRDLSTGQQIGMLLSICNTMLQALLNPEREHENIPGRRSMAGEAHAAAENTFIRACERLDSVIEEKERWGIDFQRVLEQQYNERHAESLALVKAQREAAEQQKASSAEVTAPHFRYKPMLIPMEDGAWAAFLGNVSDLDAGILGLGPNPQAALKSFDDAFAGNLSPAVTQWLEQREKDLDNGISELKPFPKLEQKHEVDTGTNGRTEGHAEAGGIENGPSSEPAT